MNKAALRNRDAYFRRFIAWTKISGGITGFRLFEEGFLFDGAGGSLFLIDLVWEDYYLAFLNSICCKLFLSIISPTVNFNESHIGALPLIRDEMKKCTIDSISKTNVLYSKNDWDSLETSWDFKKHPLI